MLPPIQKQENQLIWTYSKISQIATMLSFVRNVEHYVTDIEVYKSLLHDEAELQSIPSYYKVWADT
jgi:hypothetical protein